MTGRNILTLSLVDRNPPDEALDPGTSPCWSQWAAFKKEAGGDSEILFAAPHDRGRLRRVPWLGVSLALQAMVLGLWLLRSVTVQDELPPPATVKAFVTSVPPASMPTPPPAPPPAPPTGSTSKSAPDRLTAPLAFTALEPTAVPLDVAELGDIDFGSDDGVPGGIPGGIGSRVVGGLRDGPTPAPERPSDHPATIYVVSGELDRPDKLVHIDPVYPPIATAARVEGLVILEATIDGDGNVQDVKVLRSIPLLDEAALEAVRQWKYEPTIVGGVPVPILMTVTVKFALG